MNLDEIFKPLTDLIIQIPNYQALGLPIIFLITIIPFMPIPEEALILPLILAEPENNRTNAIWAFAIIMSVGAFIAHIITFFLAKHHLHKIVGKPNKLEKTHWFHKYGIYTMFILPTFSIFIPPATDSAMVVLGHYRASHFRLFLFLWVGELIRAYFVGIMLINLL